MDKALGHHEECLLLWMIDAFSLSIYATVEKQAEKEVVQRAIAMLTEETVRDRNNGSEACASSVMIKLSVVNR